MTDEPIMYRQGDVFIEKIAELPKGVEPEEPMAGYEDKVVLAFGEVTGHHHRIRRGSKKNPAVRAFRMSSTSRSDAEQDRRFIEIVRRGRVEHEEHTAISLEPGVYEISIQREYDPEGDVIVAD